jgi:hypothetical protein
MKLGKYPFKLLLDKTLFYPDKKLCCVQTQNINQLYYICTKNIPNIEVLYSIAYYIYWF